MKNIYNMDPHGSNEELFNIGMRNLVLHTVPPSLFGSLMTILASHIGQLISEATCTLADLGEVEPVSVWKEVRVMTERRGERAP